MIRSTARDFGVEDYRAYLVGIDGHFISYEPLVCASDDEAIAKAKRWLMATTLSCGAVPGLSSGCSGN